MSDETEFENTTIQVSFGLVPDDQATLRTIALGLQPGIYIHPVFDEETDIVTVAVEAGGFESIDTFLEFITDIVDIIRENKGTFSPPIDGELVEDEETEQ